jgi:hypothetical protein
LDMARHAPTYCHTGQSADTWFKKDVPRRIFEQQSIWWRFS